MDDDPALGAAGVRPHNSEPAFVTNCGQRLAEQERAICQTIDSVRHDLTDPIRHVVVVKNSILERHPWVARSLVDAFTKAKEIGIKHVSDTRRSFLAWYGAELEEERELFGNDAWPYNIKDNRVVLETMARYAEMVGVTDRKLEIKEMFAESALSGESDG